MIEWILTHVLSPLLLPVFLGVILFSIVGLKPDIIIKGYFDLLGTIVTLSFKLLMAALEAFVKLVCLVLCGKSDCAKDGPKKPRS